jgi:hypothetical protein
MKRYWFLVVIFVLGAITICTFAATREHWWIKTNDVLVYYNGQLANESTVYKSTDGDLLIWAKKGEEKLGVYVVLLKDSRVGKPYPNELLLDLGFCYYIRNYPDPKIVQFGTEKSYPYAQIAFSKNSLVFVLEDNTKFEINFRNPKA